MNQQDKDETIKLPPLPFSPEDSLLFDKENGEGASELLKELLREYARQAIAHDRQQREESCGAQNETQATKRIDKLRADPKKAEALEHARKRIKVAKSDIQPITSDPVRLEPTEAEEEAWRELEKRQ